MPIARPKKTALSLSYRPALGRIRIGGPKTTPKGTLPGQEARQQRSDEGWAKKKKTAWRKRKSELNERIRNEALAESIVQAISL